MKVTSRKLSENFDPVSVTFEFETQEELDLMGSLFNFKKIATILNIYDEQKQGIYYNQFVAIGANVIRFIDTWDNLLRKIKD